MDQAEAYELCKQHVKERLKDLIAFFFDQIYTPIEKKHLIEGIENIIKQELDLIQKKNGTDLPSRLYPKFHIKVDDEKKKIEFMVQHHLNDETTLMFLGVCAMSDVYYDLYMCQEQGHISACRFIARHGSKKEDRKVDFLESVEKQHEMGAVTPFSIAYEFAVDYGFIEVEDNNFI
jgi:hypothetical protein